MDYTKITTRANCINDCTNLSNPGMFIRDLTWLDINRGTQIPARRAAAEITWI